MQAAAAPGSSQNGHSNGQGQNQGGKRKNGRKRSGGGGAAQPGNGQPRQQRQGRQNAGGGAWRRGGEGPDGNREGARGGFGGSEHFQDANGNGGARRKGKFGRRGPTGFVGPMDHSYRTVNGNVADGPPSTMDYRTANGNSNGNVVSRSDYAELDPVTTLREDAPVRIVCFIEDLFIVTKMNETARKMGVKIQFAKAEKEQLAAITDGPESQRPALIVIDLNNANAKPLTLIPKLKTKLKRATSIIGFLQHVQGDLKMKAVEAGCDTVMPRAAFSLSLPNLLRRYGFDEEEELAEA
jgi:CheY-like chemotaxis protein